MPRYLIISVDFLGVIVWLSRESERFGTLEVLEEIWSKSDLDKLISILLSLYKEEASLIVFCKASGFLEC